jgi:hypothetical protein
MAYKDWQAQQVQQEHRAPKAQRAHKEQTDLLAQQAR